MALDDLLDEHEQSERVRSWIRSNALGLIGGIGLGLGAIAGWQWWQGQQLQRGMAVNGRYAQVVANYDAGRLPVDKGRAALDQIGKGNPTLATLAALQLAKAQAEAEGLDVEPAEEVNEAPVEEAPEAAVSEEVIPEEAEES